MQIFHKVTDLFIDWKFLIRRNGIKSALSTVGLEILQLPYRHMRLLVVARSLGEPDSGYQPKIDLEIRPFKQADLELVQKINRPSAARDCARRILLGHKGLVALHRGHLTGYAWGCTEIDPKLERVKLELKSGDVFCMDVYTFPAFRGQGVQTALTLARFKMFYELGYQRAICTIERNNAPSLTVWQKKFGGAIIGRIDYIRFGPWHRIRYYNNSTTKSNN